MKRLKEISKPKSIAGADAMQARVRDLRAGAKANLWNLSNDGRRLSIPQRRTFRKLSLIEKR